MQPRAYYNENNLHAAEWLYNLQSENLIAPGDIDTRPIQDVRRPAQQAAAPHEEHWYSRIGALKGLGNAIDPRPAAEFIKAAMESLT